MKRFVKDALTETNTSETEYGTDKLARDCNKAYLRIRREITQTHEDFFWNYWFTDIQVGANEYEIQRTWETDDDNNAIPGIDKVKKVYLLQGDAYVELPQLSDYQEMAGMRGWTIKDNHIILSWTPEEDITDGLKLEGTCITNMPDWTLDTDEDIFPLRPELEYYKSMITTDLRIRLWRSKQDFDKENMAKQDYAEELMELKRFITERVQSIYYTNLIY